MRCPICKKPVHESTIGQKGSTFPFCSDRCRLIDLGRWLDGKYQISADENDDESEDESTSPPSRGQRFGQSDADD